MDSIDRTVGLPMMHGIPQEGKAGMTWDDVDGHFQTTAKTQSHQICFLVDEMLHTNQSLMFFPEGVFCKYVCFIKNKSSSQGTGSFDKGPVSATNVAPADNHSTWWLRQSPETKPRLVVQLNWSGEIFTILYIIGLCHIFKVN